MNKRPLSVTIIACIYIAAGVLGLAYHLTDFKVQHPFQYDVVWVNFIRIIAILCGVFMLRGSDWARWLAIVWLGSHVGIGALHSMQEFLMHLLLLAVFTNFLFRPAASDYFRAKRTEVA